MLPREHPGYMVGEHRGQQCWCVWAGCGWLPEEEHVQRDLGTPGKTRKKPQLKVRLDKETAAALKCALRNSLGGTYSFLPPHSFLTEPFAMKQTQLEGSWCFYAESSGLLAKL